MNKKTFTLALCLFLSVVNVYSMRGPNVAYAQNMHHPDAMMNRTRDTLSSIHSQLHESMNAIVIKNQAIEQQNRIIYAQNSALEERDRTIAELTQKLEQAESNPELSLQVRVEALREREFQQKLFLQQVHDEQLIRAGLMPQRVVDTATSDTQTDISHAAMVGNLDQTDQTSKELIIEGLQLQIEQYQALLANSEKMVKTLSRLFVNERRKTELDHPIVGLMKSESLDFNDLPPCEGRLSLPAELYDTNAEASGLYVTESGLFSPMSDHALLLLCKILKIRDY